MVNFKASLKLISVIILTFGAVFICSIFINYAIELKDIEHLIMDLHTQAIYDTLSTQNKITIAASGGMLGAVTMIVLLFSIAQFINESSAELGVMKALGYSNTRISLEFGKFGLAVFAGSMLGFIAAIPAAQLFYDAFDTSQDLPVIIKYSFNFQVPLIVILAPTILFSIASVLYARLCLRKCPLDLIKNARKTRISRITKHIQNKESNRSFISELKKNMLWGNLILIFFVGFAAFGFAAQIQMAFMISEYTESRLMPLVFVSFGILLGLVTLLLALTFIIKRNSKYLAMLKAYGYTENECNKAMFGGYRIVTYIGFAIGTVYQFFFMKMMIEIFAEAHDLPEVKFSFHGFFITLALFLAAYELLMIFYRQKIAKIPLRRIMQV